jgi:hypothetical protein
VRVLLSEATSLTAREHVSVLGPTGIDIDVASCSSLAIGRFSRWCHHVVRVPCSADDPKGYLTAVADALRRGRYDAWLPTHEQAWLFATGHRLLPDDAPLAIVAIDAFDQVEGKVDCAKLLDTLGLPQPAWSVITAASDPRHVQLPCWLRASFSTADRGVPFVTSPNEAARALDQLLPAGPVLAQQAATAPTHTGSRAVLPRPAGRRTHQRARRHRRRRQRRRARQRRPCRGASPRRASRVIPQLARWTDTQLPARRWLAAVHRGEPAHGRTGQRRSQRR